MAPCLVDRIVDGLLTCSAVRRRKRLATRLLKLSTEAIRRTSHGRHPARHKPSVAVYCIRFRMILIWHPFRPPSAGVAFDPGLQFVAAAEGDAHDQDEATICISNAYRPTISQLFQKVRNDNYRTHIGTTGRCAVVYKEGYLKLNSKKYRLITALNESEKVRSGRR